jgi:hypothetical protein
MKVNRESRFALLHVVALRLLTILSFSVFCGPHKKLNLSASVTSYMLVLHGQKSHDLSSYNRTPPVKKLSSFRN